MTQKPTKRRTSRKRPTSAKSPVLYLVRWPDLSVALVHARDEDQLRELLDEVGDVEGCSWAPYRGPLFLELEVPVDVAFRAGAPATPGPADVELGGVEELVRGGPRMTARIPACETADRMVDAILERRFPALADALRSVDDEMQPDVAADLARVDAAVRTELAGTLRRHWREAGTKRSARAT